MKNLASICIFIFFSFLALGSGNVNNSNENAASVQEPTLAERYPGQWQKEFNLEISKALAQNNVHGCGEYKYKKSALNSGEFLVYCSRDGKKWNAYLVWIPLYKVMGPYPPDPSVQ